MVVLRSPNNTIFPSRIVRIFHGSFSRLAQHIAFQLNNELNSEEIQSLNCNRMGIDRSIGKFLLRKIIRSVSMALNLQILLCWAPPGTFFLGFYFDRGTSLNFPTCQSKFVQGKTKTQQFLFAWGVLVLLFYQSTLKRPLHALLLLW